MVDRLFPKLSGLCFVHVVLMPAVSTLDVGPVVPYLLQVDAGGDS